MVVDRLQELVDSLSVRLRRAVAIDDETLALVAVGEDFGEADAPRMWSLLHRRTKADAYDFERLRQLTGPVWTEPDPALTLVSRLCVPLRCRDMLVGFMWIIDGAHSLTPAQVDDAVDTAAEIARLLHQRLTLASRDTSFSVRLLDLLLGDDPEERERASVELVDYGFVAVDATAAAIVLRTDGGEADFAPILIRTLRRRTLGTWLVSVRASRAIVLLVDGLLSEDTVAELGRELQAAVVRQSADEVICRVGTGGLVEGLASAWVSGRQADLALAVSRRAGGAGRFRDPPPMHWPRLGAYRLLAQLPRDAIETPMLPEGAMELVRAPAGRKLLPTLECLLDLAGDKIATASSLGIHRSTLYYRLSQIESMTGCSLDRGEDRLLLHVLVKLDRLHGPLG
ncbi:MAG: helix-turn-helix domain-containing protein [Microbacteriaceae bacterium]